MDTQLAQVYELSPALFGGAAPLYEARWFDEPQIEAAFEGRQPGRLFVDDARSPRSALLCRTYEYYVAGEALPALRQFIADAPAEAGVFADLYGYCALVSRWTEALLDDHAGRLMIIGRRNYRYAGSRPPAGLPPLPMGIEVVPLDTELAARADRELGEHIAHCWTGYEAFAAGGIGFGVLADADLASVAYSAAVSSRHADVSVGTAPAFRRRGFAVYASTALIAECLARGLTVHWDTDDDNTASAALAERLGFVEEDPFCELATPGREPLLLSHGRWSAGAGDEGVTVWSAH